MDFKKIILNGIVQKKPVFGTYLFRKFKESQYEAEEFFFGCEAIFNQLKQTVSDTYYKQKSKFYELRIHGTDEGKDFAKSELAQFNPDNYPTNIDGYRLIKSDLEIIRNGINEARKKAANETLPPNQIDSNPTPDNSSEPEPPEAGEPENLYPRIFINGYHWMLFNEWRQQLSKNDDFSFIYRIMWEDSFIHSGIGQKEFKKWIETTFSTGDLGRQLKTLTECDSKPKYTIYQEKINKYQLHSSTLQKRSTNTTKT